MGGAIERSIVSFASADPVNCVLTCVAGVSTALTGDVENDAPDRSDRAPAKNESM